jgi:hypothetical protein
MFAMFDVRGGPPSVRRSQPPHRCKEAKRMTQQPVQSRSGTISVLTSERGLPLALRLDPLELKKPPEQLARDILALCRLSAARAQVARRRDLAERGFSAAVIRGLPLATEDELARAEEEVLGDEDDLPSSWRRPV